MSGNLGETSLARRRALRDPMRAFDALPPPLRRWLAEAALPWSPESCRRIWQRARARGEPMPEILARLDRAEARTLARDLPGFAAAEPGGRLLHQEDQRQ